jgi:hypothetical protein
MPEDLIGALERVLGRPVEPTPKPRHPDSGCPCTDCTARDNYLEDVAERRADERRAR